MTLFKTLKRAAATAIAIACTSASGTAGATLYVTPGIPGAATATAEGVFVSAYQKTISGGFFLTRDGSNLLNEFRMPNRDTLQVRRHVTSGPGGWGTFTRVGADTFRSSRGAVYTILDQNRLQFNGGRVLYRDVPIPDGAKPGGQCIDVGRGLEVCFNG